MGCKAANKKGRACQFRVKWGYDLCINHDPEQNPKLAARKASEAATKRRAERRSSAGLLRTVLVLTDRVSIQATIDAAIRLYLNGNIDHEKYRDVVHGCWVAMRNFDRAGETLAGPSPQRHDMDDYFGRVKALLGSVDLLITRPDEIGGEDLDWLEGPG